MNDHPPAPLRCGCDGAGFSLLWDYDAPPPFEISLKLPGTYCRQVWRCDWCGHYVNRHPYDLATLYRGDYVDATYGNQLRATFQRIVALPPEKSDNHGRVRRIIGFARSHFADHQTAGWVPSVLDVGSGLCVFLNLLKQEGWRCTALDPDPRQTKHAEETADVRAICADFMAAGDLGHYDVVTFNKVLEHVADPVAMLSRARDYIAPGGFVYVELPDGVAAAADGPAREEFFIDHSHIFSDASFALMVERAGFRACIIERLRDPSGKYTLCGFLVIQDRE